MLTFGFQTTPVVWYCLTYFCRASSNSENDFAQAIAAGFLHYQLGLKTLIVNLRFLELLRNSISPELSSILHLPNVRRRSRFLLSASSSACQASSERGKRTTCTQPHAPTPSPTTLKQAPHSLPSLDLFKVSLASMTFVIASAWGLRRVPKADAEGLAWVEASWRKSSWARHNGSRRAVYNQRRLFIANDSMPVCGSVI